MSISHESPDCSELVKPASKRRGARGKSGFVLSDLIPVVSANKDAERRRSLNQRQCRYEELEQRQVMSASPFEAVAIPNPPIEFGSVYYENDLTATREREGDVIQISWTGGVAGTNLSEVRINLDKNNNGQIDAGEAFFDLDDGTYGVYGSAKFHVVSMQGITSYHVEVQDGGQLLVLTFEGFDADSKFVFSLDVDEMEKSPNGGPNPTALVEGAEFEGSIITGVFTHADYHELIATAIYMDRFEDPAGRGLNLPNDNYGQTPTEEIQTAGALGQFTQIPKTGSLSGYVYEDADNDGFFDRTSGSVEKGIGGVKLELWVWSTDRYVYTGHWDTTDADGFYSFDGLETGRKYRIVEGVVPEDYFDGKDTAGSLGGDALNDEIISIEVGANRHGTEYNFGELKPCSLSGYVYEDYDCNGKRSETEFGIPDVVLTLWMWTGESTANDGYVKTGITRKTDEHGFYEFERLEPGNKYRITQEEDLSTRPEHYLEGKEEAGTLGGDALAPPLNTITNIVVGFDKHGTGYNFAKRLPASLSGLVYEDTNNNGRREPGEKPIKDVRIDLYVKDSQSGEYVWTERFAITKDDGSYRFDDLDPCKYYSVRETQPEDYIDGKDTPGDHGGTTPRNDVIEDIDLVPGEEGKDYNFGERIGAKISGYVFQDGAEHRFVKGTELPPINQIGTGKFENAQKWLSGIIVVLADENGNPLRDSEGKLITAVTNEDGYYEFDTLEGNRTYSLLETQPDDSRYIDGIDTPGTTGGMAANSYDAATLAELEKMGIRISDLRNDAIIGVHVNDGEHSQMNNFSEILVVWNDPPPVVPPGPPNPPIPPNYPPGPSPIPGVYIPPAPAFWNPGATTERLSPLWGGGAFGGTAGPTWHLSVLNAGHPRGNMANSELAMLMGDDTTSETSSRLVNVSWSPDVVLNMRKASWTIRDGIGNVSVRYLFGTAIGRPLVGDFNGDGIDDVAIYENGNWYIDLNGDGEWNPSDLWAKLGTEFDQPIVGDWDGDGKSDIGIFGPRWSGDARAIRSEPGLPNDLNDIAGKRPKNVPPSIEEATNGVRRIKHSVRGNVRADLIDHVFSYGQEGDIAITGDFAVTGISSVGVFNSGTWKIDYNGNGVWDDEDLLIENAGEKGDIPLVGSWNVPGRADIGVYRNGVWHLDTDGDRKFDTKIEFGTEGDIPVVGDFNGDGVSELALYTPADDSHGVLTMKTPGAEKSPIQGKFAAKGTGEPGNVHAQQDGQLPQRTIRTPFTDVPLDQ